MNPSLRWLALALCLSVAAGANAQDGDTKKKKTGAKPAAKVEKDDDDKNGNLPPTPKAGKVYLRPGWGKLGLDAKQLKEYEKAYSSGKAKVEAAEAVVEKAKDELDAALESILTTSQKKQLKEFKDAQDQARKERAAEKAAEEKAKKNKKKTDDK